MASGHENYAVLETALRNARVYEGAYKRIGFAFLISCMANALLAGAVAYLAFTKPEPRYFATTTQGQLLPLVPLDKPHQSASEVANYAVRAVTNSLTFDFANYRADFQNAQQYFTKPSGWNKFVGAMKKSQIVDLVKNRKVITSAVANNAVIVQESVNNRGRYQWVVQMPTRLTYQSASETGGQDFLITVTIERLQTYESPHAMAIANFIAAPG